MSAGQSRRNRNRRRARPGGEATYDGVSDARIYERDYWSCQMPECFCPSGRAIDPASFLRNQQADSPTPWRASIDHVIPLSSGGWDIAANKRAAHQLCNEAAEKHYPRGLAEAMAEKVPDKRKPTSLSYTIGDAIGVCEGE